MPVTPPSWSEIVGQAYRLAGVVKRPGVGMSGSESAEGQHVLNAMLDGLKIERAFVYQVLRTRFTFSVSKQEYRVGALSDGADWEIERPEHIYRAGLIIPSTSSSSLEAEIPVEVVLDFVQWYAIVNKVVGSALPRALYYRPDLPCGVAALWPVPTRTGEITLYTPGLVDEVEDLSVNVSFPKGYREAVEYLLAVALHDRHPEAVMNPNVEVRAREYKGRIKAAQITPLFMRSDPAATGTDNQFGRKFFDARTWY